MKYSTHDFWPKISSDSEQQMLRAKRACTLAKERAREIVDGEPSLMGKTVLSEFPVYMREELTAAFGHIDFKPSGVRLLAVPADKTEPFEIEFW